MLSYIVNKQEEAISGNATSLVEMNYVANRNVVDGNDVACWLSIPLSVHHILYRLL